MTSSTMPNIIKIKSDKMIYEINLNDKVLGNGTYGIVYAAEGIPMSTFNGISLSSFSPGTLNTSFNLNIASLNPTQAKLKVALKAFFPKERKEGIPGTTVREISIMKEIVRRGNRNPHILTFIDFFIPKTGFFAGRFILVTERMPSSLPAQIANLHHINVMGFDMDIIKKIMRGLLIGLSYLHGMGIIHRDLKPDNILLNQQDESVLCDFGLARSLTRTPKRMVSYAMTLYYRPPELLFGDTNYNFSADIWSAGCILAEMILGVPIFAMLSGDFQMINEKKDDKREIERKTNENNKQTLKMILKMQDRLQSDISIFEKLPNFQGYYPFLKPYLVSNPTTGNSDERRNRIRFVLEEAINKRRRAFNLPQENYSNHPVMEVLFHMLRLDPSKRQSAAYLLTLPWFTH